MTVKIPTPSELALMCRRYHAATGDMAYARAAKTLLASGIKHRHVRNDDAVLQDCREALAAEPERDPYAVVRSVARRTWPDAGETKFHNHCARLRRKLGIFINPTKV